MTSVGTETVKVGGGVLVKNLGPGVLYVKSASLQIVNGAFVIVPGTDVTPENGFPVYPGKSILLDSDTTYLEQRAVSSSVSEIRTARAKGEF